HKVKTGTVNKSYGLQVATLAGVPREVVAQAKAKLQQLELEDAQAPKSTPLSNPGAALKESELEKFVKKLQPDALSPREALDLIYQLKKLL
ncbi:MAG: DNA mismatch repair protein MutS, partial [Gammaproteobacteria bacterium]|nr:DNA mismatch repair protein MutS [Gammaproteobacteria bacterium]